MALSGGDKMGAYLQELSDKLADGSELRAGFLEGATYPDGESVAMVAASDEFGNPANNQPPRPFFRTAISNNQDKWARGLSTLIRQGVDIEEAFRITGEVVKSDIQGSIREFTTPELAPSTVKRKGFDKPLIDSGHMLNSVDHEVTDGGEE